LFLTEEELDRIPHTKKWLELAKNAKSMAESLIKETGGRAEMECLVEQENVVEQMNHLLSYPLVEERYKNGQLNIYGWYYDIATGTVYNYDLKEKVFNKIA